MFFLFFFIYLYLHRVKGGKYVKVINILQKEGEGRYINQKKKKKKKKNNHEIHLKIR